GGQSISDRIAAVVGTPLEPPDLSRAFTLDGRPVPPLLRADDVGGVFGAADAVQSLLRIGNRDAQGGLLYDVTTRLFPVRGPGGRWSSARTSACSSARRCRSRVCGRPASPSRSCATSRFRPSRT